MPGRVIEVVGETAAGCCGSITKRRPVPFTLSVTQMATRRWSVSDDCLGRSTAGIGAIGVYRPKLAAADAERAIRASGLRVTSVSWLAGLLDDFARCDDERSFEITEAIETARRLGADRLVIATGHTGGFCGGHARRVFADRVREVADLAAERTVRISVEMRTHAAGRRATVECGRQMAGLCDAIGRGNVDLVTPVAAAVDDEDLRLRSGLLRTTAIGTRLDSELRELADVGFDGVVELDDTERRPGAICCGGYLPSLERFRTAAERAAAALA